MPDSKKSGSRLINSKIHIARILHDCWNEPPECSHHSIFPGYAYEREVWIHWWRAESGKTFNRLEVRKFHLSPSCQPDPNFFESETDELIEYQEFLLAA
ncbi:MAG: hypothetical protein AAB618_01330 [Patescibacteria group bacterium]